jgi:rhodanese-related sulfurtransferase
MQRLNKYVTLVSIALLLICWSKVGKCTVSASSCLSIETSDTLRFYSDIRVAKANKLIAENAGNTQFVILDVRKPDDYLKEHIANAINLDFKSDDFSTKLSQFDKDKTYLVYCYGGFRSKNTVEIMKNLHFKRVYNMKGGFIKWRSKGLPTSAESK